MPEFSIEEARERFNTLVNGGVKPEDQTRYRASWWDTDNWEDKLTRSTRVQYRPSTLAKKDEFSHTLMWQCRFTEKWYETKPAGRITSDGSRFHKGDFYVGAGYLTAKNYKICCGCKSPVHQINAMHRVSDGTKDLQLCQRCITKDYKSCQGCSHFVPKKSALVQGDKYYHDKCHYRTYTEHSYSYKPKRMAYKRGKHEAAERRLLYFGLEIEATGAKCSEWSKSLEDVVNSGQFYMKHDGSVTDGIEIVSYPMTKAYMKENPKMLEELFALPKSGWQCDDSCGMHIHLSRASFTNHHALKFQDFFINNKSLLTQLSGRKDAKKVARYASFDPRKRERTSKDIARGHTSSKYVACRATDFSFEIRIFQGTLESETFLRNIELADSLYWYTRTASRTAITTTSYKTWVLSNTSSYPNLAAYFCSKVKAKQKKAKEFVCVS